MSGLRPINRSAKSGKFVSKKEASIDPEATITQIPPRLNGKTAKAIAEAASKLAGKKIEDHVAIAVIRAFRQLTRVK